MPELRERLVLYTLLTALTALSIDTILPALRQIGAEFAVSAVLSPQHVISLFVLGMAVGELFLGPLSDAIGRKPALLAGLAVYALGTAIAFSARSLEMLIVSRILQGMGVAGPKIATRAMIRDQFEGDAMARILSLMFTLFILVPMLAPILGQFVMTAFGWRSLFAMTLAMALALGLWFAVRHPETLAPTRRIVLRPGRLVANGRRVLAHRRVSCLIAATGLVFGAQLLYLATATALFHDVYGLTDGFLLVYALFSAGLGLASFLNARLVEQVGAERMTRGAFLGLGASGLLMLAASLLAGGSPPLALFLPMGFVAFFFVGLLFGNLNALAMRPLGRLAGLGASLVASGSSLISTLFAVALGALYDGTTTVLAAAFTLAAVAGLLLTEAGLRAGSLPVEPVDAEFYRR